MKYIANIYFNPDWPGYAWAIDDPAHKIYIEHYKPWFVHKKTAIADLKRWIARLHIDCEIIDITAPAGREDK
jgi:hypothetical protein